MENLGLVLEGGGMRGVYTAGILDFFMDKDLYFSYVIGVSMGACNAASYVSKQRGRNKIIDINYVNDKRYLSYRRLLLKKELFGMDFIFEEIPNSLEIFDFDTFYNAKERFVIGVTDCNSGKPLYFEKNQCKDNVLKVIRASSSLPLLNSIVNYENLQLLDGGISDPIPIKKSIEDGNSKNVIILTRNRGYIKKPFKLKLLLKFIYPKYKGLINALINRYKIYNETIKYIEKLEKEGKVFVIRPKETLEVRRVERDKKKLTCLYDQGYEEGKRCYDELQNWMFKIK
ncbi:patatin family protein [Clostridium sp. P21]|uniref:Patatin family protein n=1 Tax=Clostridium muellerianum TaxID=2716538 RepID=A0A7Y0EL53_9CLOT|nr:patatin family protein [Clostridium muellerianum]NMM65422.1 patatin family protein [Clostridium muellerianum]